VPFTSSLLCTGWRKTWTAWKLLVQVKFTGNPYSYVCEWLPLKYTQTRVCWDLYTGTRTVLDLYSCLCKCSLAVVRARTVTIYASGQSQPCKHLRELLCCALTSNLTAVQYLCIKYRIKVITPMLVQHAYKHLSTSLPLVC